MGSNPFARTSPPWRNWQRSRFVNGRFRVQLPRAALSGRYGSGSRVVSKTARPGSNPGRPAEICGAKADVGLPRAFAKRVLCHDRRRFDSCSLRWPLGWDGMGRFGSAAERIALKKQRSPVQIWRPAPWSAWRNWPLSAHSIQNAGSSTGAWTPFAPSLHKRWLCQLHGGARYGYPPA
jgi:hypothetical protein